MPHLDNVVAFWDLDSDVLDDSGNGHNGTNNGITFSGGVGHFTGSSPSDVTIPGSLLAANTYTLSLWFNPSSLATYNAMFSIYNGDSDTIEFFQTSEGGGGSGWFPDYNSSRIAAGTFTTSALYHFVGSMSAGTASIYINGSFVKTVTGTFTTFTPTGRIGSRNADFWFSGTQQSVAIYSDAKDATWVTADYNSGVPKKWADWAAGGFINPQFPLRFAAGIGA